ncbi:C-type lectin 37Da-like [Drosophila obscura]|uniref:C-type lectin 37Da-like n=1 Tax=Drosophila obscura TaxID=7282 RepID=UPI001BB16F67|nr:C-type lectin 37Da-like [Drosophila obscura]
MEEYDLVNKVPESLNISIAPFIKIGNGYYYIETRLEKNWFDAYETCRRINADLIAFETIEEWDFVNQYLIKMNIAYVYWTAGNDLGNEGKHNWFSTGKPLTLDIWYPTEPNNYDGIEHCDLFGDRRGSNASYNDLNARPCIMQRHYICEAPQPKTASFIIWLNFQMS